ncbi:hypothetical protein CMI41_04310 [Candidatus Pacearchaeota archaeon]|nr:hypothetical protein [Candidatus Pacearchaeota archaeon]|tara:strand:- start:2517 stop:2840 length:324 start_codon:yes stop_codon:yes gene_type:complete
MKKPLTRSQVESLLEKDIVCDTLRRLGEKAKRWTGGGALNHRVVAVGFLAETGARNISEGFTPIKSKATFSEMKAVDREMYKETLNLIYPIIRAGIYSKQAEVQIYF